jgi:hypothetical protein
MLPMVMARFLIVAGCLERKYGGRGSGTTCQAVKRRRTAYMKNLTYSARQPV